MAFWLLRGVLATLAVTATLVPLGTAAWHGYQVVETEAERDRMRDAAAQDLLLFQTEYALEAAIVAAKPDDTKRFFSVRLEDAQIYWNFARTEFDFGNYHSMRANIEYARLGLAGKTAEIPTARETGRHSSDIVSDPVMNYDIAAGGALASLLLWSIWGGMTRRPMPVVPVPVYPGEVEVERQEPEAPPKTSLPGLPGAGEPEPRHERRSRRYTRKDGLQQPRRASWKVTSGSNGSTAPTATEANRPLVAAPPDDAATAERTPPSDVEADPPASKTRDADRREEDKKAP